jgi:hypothetical protein
VRPCRHKQTQHQVIVTSYDVVRVDGDSLAALRPHAVVFDEVQKMKNDRSKQYEAAALLPTKARFGLSGVCRLGWCLMRVVSRVACNCPAVTSPRACTPAAPLHHVLCGCCHAHARARCRHHHAEHVRGALCRAEPAVTGLPGHVWRVCRVLLQVRACVECGRAAATNDSAMLKRA